LFEIILQAKTKSILKPLGAEIVYDITHREGIAALEAPAAPESIGDWAGKT
jgi:hypothetical protein